MRGAGWDARQRTGCGGGGCQQWTGSGQAVTSSVREHRLLSGWLSAALGAKPACMLLPPLWMLPLSPPPRPAVLLTPASRHVSHSTR